MKKFYTWIICTISFLVIGYTMVYIIHAQNVGDIQSDYNTSWIIGKTFKEIIERYGNFDMIHGKMDNDNLFHGDAGYVLRKGHNVNYVIFFNNEGKAYKVEKMIGYWGG